MIKFSVPQHQNTTDCYKHRVATVVLNYNSEQDLMTSAPQLAVQAGVPQTLILVDNASHPESVERIKAWLADWRPDAIVGTQGVVGAWVKSNPEDARAPGRVYFVTHHENRGYSAGNNIGIRLADSLGVDAVLIANPDMRIENSNYLVTVTKELFSDERNYVAASRIVDLDHMDQSPLREPGFLEELFWPRYYLSKFLKPITYVLSVKGPGSVKVPKVSGCCMLLRMSFLRATNYLDEGVFLYCEEPILAARVRNANGHIVHIPSLTAVHAHVRNEKGNSSSRMLLFIKSRLYYLEHYSSYNRLQQFVLWTSYWLLGSLHKIKLGLGGGHSDQIIPSNSKGAQS